MHYRRAIISALVATIATPATAAPSVPLPVTADDVIPTANDWIALPSIRASDGAAENFNVLSMHYRGLLEASGPQGKPLVAPFLEIDGRRQSFSNLAWSVLGYWTPTGVMRADGIEARLTWVTPPGYRAAILRLTLTNLRRQPIEASLGIDVNWGATKRVTYAPVALTGNRVMRKAPWDEDMQVFAYGIDDSAYSWALSYSGAEATLRPAGDTPGLTALRRQRLAPGASLDIRFTIAAGIEEYGVTKTITVVDKAIDRAGLDAFVSAAADDAMRFTRRTGDSVLDRLMNRNYLFTRYFAWGRAIDTEQLVGVTSRSGRYYVSAAYWDRDAMLWSFPALLDVDPARAKEALDYAFGVQGRNAGVHSRYIDGLVLEDGFELDELVAPIIALASYVAKTGNVSLLTTYADRIDAIRTTLAAHRDAATGLYDTFQDAQDEYIKKPFQVYANVLTWKAFGDLAELDKRRGRPEAAALALRDAIALKAAIMRYGVARPPGGGETIFASAVDGTSADFNDVPPGSLMKLPALGFINENDPLFRRTYEWLHSSAYKWSFFDQPYGLPGSYRLPFTTSWLVADHLRLKAGRTQAANILRSSVWDGGIITEGVAPDTGRPDNQGRAFATAAGYVAHALCDVYCIDRK